MDTPPLVEKQIDDGQKLINELLKHGFEVTGAFWLKVSDENHWSFYIVSPLVENGGLREAYSRLHPLIRAMPKPFWIDLLEIKLIEHGSKLAKDVRGLSDNYFCRRVSTMRWHGKIMGNMVIEDAYFYPVPVSTP